MIGTLVVHYRVLEKLGGGGMGVVYRAEDTRLGRGVALKFLPEDFHPDPETLERFQREARAASALNHPHICTVYDIGTYEGRPFLVMELLEGQSLKERMESKPLSMEEILDLGGQIADALAAAHGKGIVHRDIKPANLFVSRTGQIKVLDFGLAKLSSENELMRGAGSSESPTIALDREHLTSPGTTIGTVSYMSPEQARGQEADARTDLFSFGVVLYEMATRRLPFDGPTKPVVFEALLGKAPVPPRQINPAIPEDFERIILKALEKDRETRYQSASDMRADIKRLARQTDSSHSVPVAAPAVAARRRRPWQIPAAAAALVLAGAGAWWWHSRSARPVSQKDTVVVADFVNTTGDPVFDSTLKQALAVQLEQSPYLRILSEGRVRSALQYMGRSPDERLTTALAREVCEREGFKAMLSGSIASLGSRYVIALNAMNCSTGDALAREQVEASDKEHVLKALGTAVSSVRGKLGESLVSIQKLDRPIEEVTTSSLEAFKAFALAEGEKNKGHDDAAIPLYEHAVELDPNFAVAYGRLGVLHGNHGDADHARNYYRKAFALIDRVSERERLYITSHYYAEGTRETAKAIETLELYRRTYPRDPSPVNNLALQYENTGQLEKAAEGFREAMRMDPEMSVAYGNLAHIYISLNRLDEAKAICERELAKGWDNIGTRQALYQIAVIENDAAGLARQEEWARANSQEGVLQMDQIWMAEQAGQSRKAEALTRQAVDWNRQHDRNGVAGFLSAAFALWRAELGSCEHVQERTREALALNRDAVLVVAPSLVLCGDFAPAETLLAELHKEFPNDTINNAVSIPAVQALIAIRRKQPDRALDLLQSATPYERVHPEVIYVRGLAHLEAKSGAAAMADFQTLLDHRSAYKEVYAVAHVGLARAAALAGDKAKSRQVYQNFLALWKDADPDIPLLQEVKKEYARLQ